MKVTHPFFQAINCMFFYFEPFEKKQPIAS